MIKKRILYLIFFNILLAYFSHSFKVNSECNIEVGFSHGPKFDKTNVKAIDIILNAIKNSSKSIKIAAYSFTSKEILNELLKAKKRGIRIQIVADEKSNKRKYNIIDYLVNNNIEVKLNNRYSIMHNKFIIFDDESVETGSFNFTNSAVRHNAENVILVRYMKNITDKYLKEFNRLWKESYEIEKSY